MKNGIPTLTPWGHSQTERHLAEGIIRFDTISHGGFWISEERRAEMIARAPALAAKTPFAGHNWYEEDCDWAIVALTFPEFFPEQAIKAAKETLRNWEPDIYEAHFGVDLAPGESYKKDQRIKAARSV
jgi:uncharacterized protein DUF7007